MTLGNRAKIRDLRELAMTEAAVLASGGKLP
jgi:hypothetical protein